MRKLIESFELNLMILSFDCFIFMTFLSDKSSEKLYLSESLTLVKLIILKSQEIFVIAKESIHRGKV